MKEYSKWVVFCVLLLTAVAETYILRMWAAGIPGAPAMASIFMTPAVTAIGFYAWKARSENVLKIYKSGTPLSLVRDILRNSGEDAAYTDSVDYDDTDEYGIAG